jgi:transcriptional regulator
MSKANSQWRETLPGSQALAIFQGPQAYISPSWYPTKQETGRVVPTWNYAVVHAHGTLCTFDDSDLLLDHLRSLTALQESRFREPWTIDDAPPDFIRGLTKAIVGIEIPITRLEGKWKMSQNRSPKDRAGVIEGLDALGDDRSGSVAKLIAEVPAENSL